MAVFRIERTRDYTVMSNHHLRDKALSLKSKGLLSMMLSLPEDWNYTTRGLAKICKEGVDAIAGGCGSWRAPGTSSATRCGTGRAASATPSTLSTSSLSPKRRIRPSRIRLQVAGEAGVPFSLFQVSDFVEMFVGVGASAYVTCLKRARSMHHVSSLLMRLMQLPDNVVLEWVVDMMKESRL